ncbi:16S rRNA (guanine(527)-N(7))-methyltransferase RsmG [Alkalibacter rhizosphaerae]|uniref:Ribosomal RNA small subunit methyltransferase G n=1 Tax=Alkalibacter rhizosphaerae TaxID=2815577 RepID=A0A974XD24_9FIRM|nr:16S rRNA (guanine(527)-N(7))-methyltransferase RsmG [Alkalibacter rhizosphaerae]QSX07574.1 16S rRNA (guanine(527)-N(7))-methyltransferase RsmG [Alkalibacter rhizosphaerae]
MNEDQLLKEGLKNVGVEVSQEQVRQLMDYMDLVLEENKVMNLTAITQPEEFIQKHLLDSISMWPGEASSQKVLDLGTGGGFPGIPLKIVHPDWDLVLLDSTLKKLKFLEKATEQMELDQVSTIHGRAEDLGHEETYREAFDLVFSRAVASLNTLLEYCIPFAKVGGLVVAAKGPKCREELEAAKNAMKKLHCVLEEVREVQIPGDEATRFVVVIRKTKTTPAIYPRKQGLPGKKPL